QSLRFMALQELWLIDGCNLIHACEKRYADKAARMTLPVLINRLGDFAQQTRIQIRVVLDGVGPEAELEAFQTDRLSVHYSQGVSADTALERFLTRNRPGPSCVVITDDRAVASMARGLGCRVFATTEMLEQLRKTGGTQQEQIYRQDCRSRTFNRPFDQLLDKKNL
ncbi:MAG: NYN domain-containing protein, partial [Candidatus Omnitrophota bacterium]